MSGDQEWVRDSVEKSVGRRSFLSTVLGGVAASASGIGRIVTGDAASGDLLWEFDTGSAVHSPTVVNGTVYVGADDRLYAVDAETGTAEWQFQHAGDSEVIRRYVTTTDATTVVDDVVYVAEDVPDVNTRTYVYAVDASAGIEQWRFEADGGFTTPTVAEGTVYIGNSGFGEGTLFALDGEDGTGQWQFATDGGLVAPPVVADGTVYVGDLDGTVYAIDAEEGAERWSVTLDGSQWCAPTVDSETVYTAVGGMMYALDTADGSTRWSFEIGVPVHSSPTVADETVYVGSGEDTPDQEPTGSAVYALDTREGTEQWSFETAGSVTSSPTVADETIYIGDTDTNVYALAVTDGTERWSFTTGGSVTSAPIVVDGVLYVGSTDGKLYALQTGVDASSIDSRVRLGTLNHHDDWFSAGDSIEAPIGLDRVRQQRGLSSYGLTALFIGCLFTTFLALSAGIRSQRQHKPSVAPDTGVGTLLSKERLGSGVPLLITGMLISTVGLVGILPTGEYSIWWLPVTPLLYHRLTGGFSAAFGVAASVLLGWVLQSIGVVVDHRHLTKLEGMSRISSVYTPSLKFSIAAVFPIVSVVLDVAWIIVTLFSPVFAFSYVIHRESLVTPNTGRSIWAELVWRWLASSRAAIHSLRTVFSAGSPDEHTTAPSSFSTVTFEVIDSASGQPYSAADQIRAVPDRLTDRPGAVGALSHTSRISLSGGRGEYNLPPGQWQFVVRDSKGANAKQKVTIDDETEHITFGIEPYTVPVQVLGGVGGDPVEDATVTVAPGDIDYEQQAQTDSQGRTQVDLPRLTATGSITATHDAYPSTETRYQTEDIREHEQLTIELTPDIGWVEIEAVLGSTPCPNIGILITPNSAETEVRSDEHTLTTDTDGKGEIELPVGRYEVATQAQSDVIEITDTVENITVEAGMTTSVTLQLGICFTLSPEQRKRLSTARDRLNQLTAASDHDVAIPRYYGTVITSLIELVETVEARPERVAEEGIQPKEAAAALLAGIETGVDVIATAMSHSRNVTRFQACTGLPSADVSWDGKTTLDTFLTHVERGIPQEHQRLQDQIDETDIFLDRQWSEVTELRPASQPLSLIKERATSIDADDEIVAVAHIYVYLCLLDAIESLFEYDALRRRLGARDSGGHHSDS